MRDVQKYLQLARTILDDSDDCYDNFFLIKFI